jgi:hypothetical protein
VCVYVFVHVWRWRRFPPHLVITLYYVIHYIILYQHWQQKKKFERQVEVEDSSSFSHCIILHYSLYYPVSVSKLFECQVEEDSSSFQDATFTQGTSTHELNHRIFATEKNSSLCVDLVSPAEEGAGAGVGVKQGGNQMGGGVGGQMGGRRGMQDVRPLEVFQARCVCVCVCACVSE